MSIAKRGRLYHLRRRVPRRYRSIEPRETVWISLHTDSETIARSKADQAWSQMIEAWEARYEAARDLARARGFLDSVPGSGVILLFGLGLAAVTGRRFSPGPWV